MTLVLGTDGPRAEHLPEQILPLHKRGGVPCPRSALCEASLQVEHGALYLGRGRKLDRSGHAVVDCLDGATLFCGLGFEVIDRHADRRTVHAIGESELLLEIAGVLPRRGRAARG